MITIIITSYANQHFVQRLREIVLGHNGAPNTNGRNINENMILVLTLRGTAPNINVETQTREKTTRAH